MASAILSQGGSRLVDDGCHLCFIDRADLGDKERLGCTEMLSL